MTDIDYTLHITLDDLPEKYRLIAEKHGIEAALTLDEEVGGTTTWFPSLRALKLQARNAQIRNDREGSNYDYLCKKYGLSPRQIRRIVDNSPF